jgi:nucleotide-binding universal stress UspA family protein
VVRDAGAFEASARRERPLRALVAADFSLASDAAVGWSSCLRRLGPCEITLFHSYDPVREWSRLGAPGRPSVQGSPEIEAILLRDLRARVAAVLSDGAVEVRVIPSLDWTAETVASVAEREGFDVILVGGHRRHGLARIAHHSVSERLLALAPASVVRVPLQAASVGSRAVPRLVHILAPTDLSELGNDAVRYAYAMAPAGCTVHLLHVVEDAPLPNPLYAHYAPVRRATPEERAELDRGLERALRALVPAEAERRGIETGTHVAHEGRPADVIRTLAERLGVDVICLGTHGRSGVSRLFGGSVAREIAAESPRPLLLVHPAADHR